MRMLALVLIAAVVSASAQADEPRWYAGLSGGSTSSRLSQDQVNAFAHNTLSAAGLNAQTVGSTSFDDSDMTWSILGGYRISRYFSIEAAYVDLGSTKYQYSGEAGRIGGTIIPPRPVVFAPATARASIDSSGFSIKGSGIVPIGERFNVHGHLGAFIADTEITISGGTPGRNIEGAVDDDSQNVMYGLGAGYRVYDHWMVSVDWHRYADLGIDQRTIEESSVSFTEDDIEGDMDTLTLSVVFEF